MLQLPALTAKLADFAHLSAIELASQEEFWQELQAMYQLSPDFVNIENGYYGVLPMPILEAYKKHIDELNNTFSYYMRREQAQDMLRLKERLAPLVGCLPTEIAFSRNATESLNVILNGIDLKPNEEILLSVYDYPSAIDACAQRFKRYGTPYRLMQESWFDKTDAEIVAIFEQHIRPETRLLLVTHLIHYTGQVLPVREITAMAQAKGVEVLVDSSHALAQIDFQVSAIGCDYWVANLHKWLYAPLTAGIIAIKQEKIHRIWGLLGDNTYPETDIRKLERFSALPMPTYLTVFDCLEFHALLGIDRKQARLRYLQQYWTEKIRAMPHVHLYTPRENSFAIASFAIKGLPAKDVVKELWEKYKIFCATVQVGKFEAVRITVQLHTRLHDLDTLVAAVGKLGE